MPDYIRDMESGTPHHTASNNMTPQEIETACKAQARATVKFYKEMMALTANDEDGNGELIHSLEKLHDKLAAMHEECFNREFDSEEYC